MDILTCKNNMYYKSITVISLFLLNSCGGSGSSNISGSLQDNNRVIERMPGSYLIETPYYINSSDAKYLYLATDYSLLKIDKSTGVKRTIAGNMSEGDVFRWRGVIQNPFGLQLRDDFLYAGNSNGRVMRVYTGADSFDAIEQFLPQLTGVANFNWMAGNRTTLFFRGDAGIYAKNYGTLDLPTLMLPLKSWYNTVATDNALFIISAAKELLRFDLNTHQLSTIRSNITTQTGLVQPAPMAISGTKLFWMDDKSVYSMDLNTLLPQIIATISTNDTLKELVADDQYVYVKPTTLYTIYKVELGSGTVSSLAIPQTACGLAVAGGNLYFGIAYMGIQLYSLSDTGVLTKVFDSVGTDLGPFGGAWDVQLISDGGKICVKTRYKILIYDTVSGTYDIIFPLIYTDMMYAQGGKLYVGSSAWIQRVLSIPVDRKIRGFDEIFPAFSPGTSDYYSVTATASDQSNIYWLLKMNSISSTVTNYRISKANLDGSNYQLLYETQSELRDLTIHNGKLYFTGNNLFGASGWEIVSLPLTGGVPSLVGKLLLDPKTFYKRGIFFIADTGDYATRRLYAVNVDTGSAVELIRDLVYDDQYTNDVFIDISYKWLYVAQQQMRYNSMPFRKLSRYRNEGYGKIGSEEVIVSPNIDVNGFIVTSISTDGQFLYFWHDGLNRLVE